MDLAAVGERISELRRLRGLSQRQLARMSGVDPGYLSRIERGLREAGDSVLNSLARALGCTVHHLRTGELDPGDPRRMDLELNFAEIALRTGDDPHAARARFAAVLDQARALGDEARAVTALFGFARACEAEGDLLVAVEAFQALADRAWLPPTVDRVKVQMLLCKTYTALGDLDRAVDVGEAALREHERAGQAMSEPVIKLASTLVGIYYERDDLVRAEMLVTKALAETEQTGTAEARGAVLWNAAYVAQARGDIEHALRLTERALALLGEAENRWAVATLRRNAGWLMLQLPDARPEQVRPVLERALAELQSVGRPADIAETEAELARCDLLAGDVRSAAELAATAVERSSDGPVLEHAKASLVLAEVMLAEGRVDEASETYRAAALALDRVKASRDAAAAWRRLGSLLMELGRFAEAGEAYERLADARRVPKLASTSRPVTS